MTKLVFEGQKQFPNSAKKLLNSFLEYIRREDIAERIKKIRADFGIPPDKGMPLIDEARLDNALIVYKPKEWVYFSDVNKSREFFWKVRELFDDFPQHSVGLRLIMESFIFHNELNPKKFIKHITEEGHCTLVDIRDICEDLLASPEGTEAYIKSLKEKSKFYPLAIYFSSYAKPSDVNDFFKKNQKEIEIYQEIYRPNIKLRSVNEKKPINKLVQDYIWEHPEMKAPELVSGIWKRFKKDMDSAEVRDLRSELKKKRKA